MKSLSALLKQRVALVAALDKLNASEPKMSEEREKLLADLDLDANPPTALTNLTIRLEAVPRKRAQLEAQVAAIDEELRPAIRSAGRKICAVVRAEAAKLREEIVAAIKTFVPGVLEDDYGVSQVYYQSERYNQRIAHLDISISRYDRMEPGYAADEVATLALKFDLDLDKLPEPAPEPVPEPVKMVAFGGEVVTKEGQDKARAARRISAPVDVAALNTAHLSLVGGREAKALLAVQS